MTPARRRRPSSAARRNPAKARQRAKAAREELPEPPEYLKRLGVRPRKALGQHFLVDEFLLGDIADAAVRDADVPVLEIGAGPGGLTEELAKRAKQVVAIELDEELAALTRERLREHTGLHLLAADVLDFEPIELLQESGAEPPLVPYVAVGNLPYYITQPIVRKLLESDPAPQRIVILIQREVALRMVGGEGKESLLSISIKLYGEPRLLFPVPRQAFWPPPQVQSAVVEIERFERPALDLTAGEIEAFFHIVRAGFAQPRKQIHNSLVDESGLPRDEILAMLDDARIEPAARPQHLSLQDWERMFRAFMARFPGELDVIERGRGDFTEDFEDDDEDGPEVFDVDFDSDPDDE
ncbi:MAG: ribosomal RNA small subunit methyltransferase A [Dehalococcoidia bacterium]|nr:ribosomal RNA small subunit methyltransferase A [Dehalococcoidia bacterium]MCA9850735.1 ribosomal RNA small subunit methyltransferase A [Dehalococcoidia bacterium]